MSEASLLWLLHCCSVLYLHVSGPITALPSGLRGELPAGQHREASWRS